MYENTCVSPYLQGSTNNDNFDPYLEYCWYVDGQTKLSKGVWHIALETEICEQQKL